MKYKPENTNELNKIIRELEYKILVYRKTADVLEEVLAELKRGRE